jgi:hypothetical protein
MRANIETDWRVMSAFLKRSMLFGLMMTLLAAHVQCEWPQCPQWLVERAMSANTIHALIAVFVFGAWFGSVLSSFRR